MTGPVIHFAGIVVNRDIRAEWQLIGERIRRDQRDQRDLTRLYMELGLSAADADRLAVYTPRARLSGYRWPLGHRPVFVLRAKRRRSW